MLTENINTELFTLLPIGMFQVNLQGNFIYANNAAACMLGYADAEEIISVNIETDIYVNKQDRLELLKTLDEKGVIKDYKVSLKKKDGTVIIASLDETWVNSKENGKIYIAAFRDITDEVLREKASDKAIEKLKAEKQKAKQMVSEAVHASEAKSRFIASMSHEIRTPMNGVLGFLDLIEQEVYESKDELKGFVNKARTAAVSLLDIINNILDISKIEAGRMELESYDFSIREVMDNAISTVTPLADEKGLVINSSILDEVPLLLIGDPVRIRQILQNLLSNAIKFTTHGSIDVEIRLQKIEGMVATILASVKDSGIGIPEDKLSLLFQPYSQVSNSYTRTHSGTGLGLRICKEFINMMGGEIGVESQEGNGSKFYFTAKLKINENYKG